MEAILNCKDKTNASFLCILGLSSVTNRNISVMYPDCGELRFKILFNQRVNPRLPLKCKSDDLHILYRCYDSVPPSQIFKPNHFVPIIFGKIRGKRSLPQPASKKFLKRTHNIDSLGASIKTASPKISSFFFT